MKIDFLQIGFQKCGTTFLEKNVYPHNPNIHCIQASRNRELERLLIRDFILPDGLEYRQVVIDDALPALTDRLFGGQTTNGIMFEPFTFMYQRRFDRKNVIDRIRKTLPNAKIIIFIRNQKTWILSHYSQYLKGGGLLSLHDFVECILCDPYLDGHYIDWYPLISYIHKVFGEEDTFVALYEDLKCSPQSVADGIFSFLGVPSYRINPGIANPSLSSYSLGLRRILNHFLRFDVGGSSYAFNRDLFGAEPAFFAKLRHKAIYRAFKPATNEICYRFDAVLRLRSRIRITDDQIKKIDAKYSENNARLSDLLHKDLSSYGYPSAESRRQTDNKPGFWQTRSLDRFSEI